MPYQKRLSKDRQKPNQTINAQNYRVWKNEGSYKVLNKLQQSHRLVKRWHSIYDFIVINITINNNNLYYKLSGLKGNYTL